MTTLRQAAEQALEALDGTEALLSSMGVTHLLIYKDIDHAINALREALAQPEWVGLTREEMFECGGGGGMLNRDEERLCRYIEAKLKEKNT